MEQRRAEPMCPHAYVGCWFRSGVNAKSTERQARNVAHQEIYARRPRPATQRSASLQHQPNKRHCETTARTAPSAPPRCMRSRSHAREALGRAAKARLMLRAAWLFLQCGPQHTQGDVVTGKVYDHDDKLLATLDRLRQDAHWRAQKTESEREKVWQDEATHWPERTIVNARIIRWSACRLCTTEMTHAMHNASSAQIHNGPSRPTPAHHGFHMRMAQEGLGGDASAAHERQAAMRGHKIHLSRYGPFGKGHSVEERLGGQALLMERTR